MEIVFFIGSSQAFVFSLLVWRRAQKGLAEKVLSLWLLILAIHFLFPAFIYRNFPSQVALSGYDAGLFLFHGLCLFLYTRAKITSSPVFTPKMLWHGLPILLIYVLMIPCFTLDSAHKIAIHLGKEPLPLSLILAMGTLYLGIIAYLVASVMALKRYRRELSHHFSDHERINLTWLRNLIVSVMGFYGLTLLATPILLWAKMPPFYVDYSFYLLLMMISYDLGYFGRRQLSVTPVEAEKTESEKVCPTPSATDQTLAASLQAHMKLHKPHLEGELSLRELAEQLAITPHTLSHILNSVIGKNFYDFINGLRIDEFLKLHHARPEQTLLSLALQSGFNSKASFNRVFRQLTSRTPSEYVKQLDKAQS